MPIRLDETGNSGAMLPIIPQEVQALRDNYENLPPSINTKSGWVSVNELMALISDNGANGVRIYFGRHSRNTSSYSTPYPDQNTIVLVATLDKKNPTNPSTYDSVDLLDEHKNSVSFTSGYQGMGGDMIPLCPPNCPNP